MKMYLDGSWVDAESGETIQVINPATGQILDSVPKGNREDAIKAIEAARKSFNKIAGMTVFERAKILSRASELIEQNVKDLVILETKELGKPIKETIWELRYVAEGVKAYGESVKRLFGDVRPSAHKNRRVLVWYEPIGVLGIVTCYAPPFDIPAVNMAAAIACGDSFVLKPSSETPLCALKLAEIFEQAGCPPGVLNVVTGPGSVVGDEIITNPGTDMIAFYGRTETWEIVGQKIGGYMTDRHIKRQYLALGSKNPLIVCEDADLDRAVEVTLVGAYSESGQAPMSTEQVLVHEKVYDDFLTRLVDRVKQLVVGDPLSPKTDIGPMVSERRAKVVEDLVKDAVEKGAGVLIGGKRFKKAWFEPTVMDNVSSEMLIAQRQIFGPVTCVTKFSKIDEAIDMVNKSKYGNRAGIITPDLREAFHAAEKAHVGTFVINEGTYQWEAYEAWGGTKKSGLNKGAYERLFTFSEKKCIILDYGTELETALDRRYRWIKSEYDWARELL